MQKILEKDLALQIIKWADHYQKGKKVITLLKDELDGQIMNKFAGLRAEQKHIAI